MDVFLFIYLGIAVIYFIVKFFWNRTFGFWSKYEFCRIVLYSILWPVTAAIYIWDRCQDSKES